MSELENEDGLSFDGEEELETLESEQDEEGQEEAEPEGEPEPEEPSTEGPESASGEDDADDKSVDSERFVKRINKKHREMMEAKEEAERLRKELEEARKTQTAEAPPEIPKVDPYADDYEEQLKARDRALIARSKWEAKEEARLELEREAKAKAAQAEQERFAKIATDFYARGEKQGLKAERINDSAGALAAMGFPQDVARDLLEDDDGPLIITYIASNPEIADQFIGASGYKAAQLIEKQVRSAIRPAAKKPSVKPAPEPDEPIRANVGAADNPLLSGMTFD